jgi:transposase-like protein
MIRYSNEQKAEALNLAAEIGVLKASEQLNISVQTVYKWKRDAEDAANPSGRAGKSARKRGASSASAANDEDAAYDASPFDDGSKPSMKDLQTDNIRLIEENSMLKAENRRLKSAIAVLTN